MSVYYRLPTVVCKLITFKSWFTGLHLSDLTFFHCSWELAEIFVSAVLKLSFLFMAFYRALCLRTPFAQRLEYFNVILVWSWFISTYIARHTFFARIPAYLPHINVKMVNMYLTELYNLLCRDKILYITFKFLEI